MKVPPEGSDSGPGADVALSRPQEEPQRRTQGRFVPVATFSVVLSRQVEPSGAGGGARGEAGCVARLQGNEEHEAEAGSQGVGEPGVVTADVGLGPVCGGPAG